MIDAIALIVKGALIGGLGGLLLPTLLISIVFNGSAFIHQFSNGSGVLAIVTSLITIPFSTLFVGLLEGGLVTTAVFGMATGAAVALVVALSRRFGGQRLAAVVCAVLATLVALVLLVMQPAQMTLLTGLSGAWLWLLMALYVAATAWLGWALRAPSVA